MDTSSLKKFAPEARQLLIDQVTSRLNLVLDPESKERREKPNLMSSLQLHLSERGESEFVEQIAYTWFNRFVGLRFMDVNRYTRIGIVSPVDGHTQPEILAEAMMGHIDSIVSSSDVQADVRDILSGSAPSRDPEADAYRLLLVAACNYYHEAMPFVFQPIDNFTELLIPDDLLSSESVLSKIRKVMTPEVCKDVEVIGWLYQFYISEKKDEVFAGFRKSQKATPETIPAATQLFTPNWIVRYLVENSLGRLWLLNRPESKLVDSWSYYIPPETVDTDYLRIDSPEEIKVCDPACGSGHMLVYAFDMLYSMYEEEGYDPTEIPELILTKNLYGIEIDERAAALASFALTMKARAYQRHFLAKQIVPNVKILENIQLTSQEIDSYAHEIGPENMTAEVRETLMQFTDANNFGSLIQPILKNPRELLAQLENLSSHVNVFQSSTHDKVLSVLQMADYLSPKYHVVIANPPYMGRRNMNVTLTEWLDRNYPNTKTDLFSAFIERNLELSIPGGQLGFMTPFVWMFIQSHERLRLYIIEEKTITSLVQLEYSGFEGATVPICTFTLENTKNPQYRGGYVRLSNFPGADQQGPMALKIIQAARKKGA